MNDRRAIARQSIAAALRTRLSVGYGLDHAVCVYDIAEKLGLEVRFLDLPTMEGMYSSASSPTIIVSSLRPPGRRAFTCAHELGHHNRSDGVEIDELVEQWYIPRFDPKEFAADCFAGALLHAQDGRLQCIRDSRLEHGGLHTRAGLYGRQLLWRWVHHAGAPSEKRAPGHTGHTGAGTAEGQPSQGSVAALGMADATERRRGGRSLDREGR